MAKLVLVYPRLDSFQLPTESSINILERQWYQYALANSKDPSVVNAKPKLVETFGGSSQGFSS